MPKHTKAHPGEDKFMVDATHPADDRPSATTRDPACGIVVDVSAEHPTHDHRGQLNQFWARYSGHPDIYLTLGAPVAAGLLYLVCGVLLSLIITALAMSLRSVSVIGNSLRLCGVRV